MTDLRDFFDRLLFQEVRRFTQQSPAMPEVWYHYFLEPDSLQDLILVPDWKSTPAILANELSERLSEKSKGDNAKIAYNQSTVVAKICFEDVVRHVLPLSGWWRKYLAHRTKENGCREKKPVSVDPVNFFKKDKKLRDEFLEKLVEDFKKPGQSREIEIETNGGKDKIRFTPEIVWLAQVIGTIAYISKSIPKVFNGKSSVEEVYKAHSTRSTNNGQKGDAEPELMAWLEKFRTSQGEDYPAKEIAEEAMLLFKDMVSSDREEYSSLFIINRNRLTTEAIVQSTSAIKADAAQRLFDVRGKGITWAVLDSGIDATHLAFRERPSKNGLGNHRDKAFQERDDKTAINNTRIKASYNFIHIRDLLSLKVPKGTIKEQMAAISKELEQGNKELFDWLTKLDRIRKLLDALKSQKGRAINWEVFGPILRIPHDDENYSAPTHSHGTHVAGIIGADWRIGDTDEDGEESDPSRVMQGSDRMTGVCPEIELYDLRVLNDKGQGNEFSIMAALQFVRFLNDRHDYVEIHGVNLSFSITHDVSNYACGRTPICVECEQLVGNGIVVVAAAGNSGRARYLRPDGIADEGFRTVSITDPGNAEGVITVGSTHRIEPHTYGVSYFSSRGPTGDGRLKPDIIAPGEKICSTIPGNKSLYLDGTSMAAPHVSGAAALLMDRNYEFMKRPNQIKKVLCDTATDLGREPYFQGAGLLDILRALQSV